MVKEAVNAGYKLARALSVFELASSTWYYHQNDRIAYTERHAYLRPILEGIIQKHPSYGYRRIKVELERQHNLTINHKVILKLLKLWNLNINREITSKAESPIRKNIRKSNNKMNLLNSRERILPLEAMVTDFTEVRYNNGEQKAYLMAILGLVSKMIYGWGISKQANTALALKAWQRAQACFRELGIDWKGMIMHHDRDSVYTGYRCLKQLLIEDGVNVSYAERGAKDNTAMESFNGHFKGENKSLFLESSNVDQLAKIVEGRVLYYNRARLHSALDYTTPHAYINSILNKNKQS